MQPLASLPRLASMDFGTSCAEIGTSRGPAQNNRQERKPVSGSSLKRHVWLAVAATTAQDAGGNFNKR